MAVSKRLVKRFDSKGEPDEIISLASSPEGDAILSQRRRAIHRLIDALPEKLRRPLALSSLQDMTSPEIAAIMDLPEGTVRRLLAEARALLKEKLSRLEGSHD